MPQNTDLSKSVDLNNYTSENIISGDNIILYVGPAKYNVNGNWHLVDPGEDDSRQTLKLVGLAQGINFSTARPQRQVPELGSKAKYLVSSRGQKQMSISRIMTTQGSILYALYRSLVEGDDPDNVPLVKKPAGRIWMSMDHPLFKKPIGVMLRLVRYGEDESVTDLQRTYFEDVTVASLGSQITEGERGIAENMNMQWALTVPAKLGGTNV